MSKSPPTPILPPRGSVFEGWSGPICQWSDQRQATRFGKLEGQIRTIAPLCATASRTNFIATRKGREGR
jgi:hypothetical protein